MKQRSKRPTRKLVAVGGGGLALGTPLGTIVIYSLEQVQGHPFPTPVSGAIGIVVALAVAAACGYLTAPGKADEVIPG